MKTRSDLSSEKSYFSDEGTKPCSNVKTIEIYLAEFLCNLQKLLLSKVFVRVSLKTPTACVSTLSLHTILWLSMDITQALCTDLQPIEL